MGCASSLPPALSNIGGVRSSRPNASFPQGLYSEMKLKGGDRVDIHVAAPMYPGASNAENDIPSVWIRIHAEAFISASIQSVSLTPEQIKAQTNPTYQIREFPAGSPMRSNGMLRSLDVKLNNVLPRWRNPSSITYYLDSVIGSQKTNMTALMTEFGWVQGGRPMSYRGVKQMFAHSLVAKAGGILFNDKSTAVLFPIDPNFYLVLDYDPDNIDVAILRTVPWSSSAFTLRYKASPGEVMDNPKVAKRRVKGKLYQGKPVDCTDRTGAPVRIQVYEKVKLDDLAGGPSVRTLHLNKVTIVHMTLVPLAIIPFMSSALGQSYSEHFGWDAAHAEVTLASAGVTMAPAGVRPHGSFTNYV